MNENYECCCYFPTAQDTFDNVRHKLGVGRCPGAFANVRHRLSKSGVIACQTLSNRDVI